MPIEVQHERAAGGNAVAGAAVMTRPWSAASEHLLRELAPQALGAVVRRFHDFSSAEDAVQEAMIAAFTQ